MPTKAKKDEPVEDAATPAVAEIVDPKRDVSFVIDGHTYSFKRKRTDALQFRIPMQKRQDAAAIEWLLGPAQFELWLTRSADEDGCTSEEKYTELLTAIGAELGTGNS